jgi:hypothetical protein
VQGSASSSSSMAAGRLLLPPSLSLVSVPASSSLRCGRRERGTMTCGPH